MFKPWTDIEIQKMLDMEKKGKTFRQIAEALGRTRSAIAGKINRVRPNIGRARKKLKALSKIKIDHTLQGNTFDDGRVPLADAKPNQCRYMYDHVYICGKEVFKREMCEECYKKCWRHGGRL